MAKVNSAHAARSGLVFCLLLISTSAAPSQRRHDAMADPASVPLRAGGITLLDRTQAGSAFVGPRDSGIGEQRIDRAESDLASPNGSAQIVITGSITNGDSTQTGRLTTGSISNCTGTNTCPGPVDSNARHQDAYTFVNNRPTQACITVQLNASTCGGTFMASASYLGSFNPASLCTNFLGVHNSTFNGTQSYSFNVPGRGIVRRRSLRGDCQRAVHDLHAYRKQR